MTKKPRNLRNLINVTNAKGSIASVTLVTFVALVTFATFTTFWYRFFMIDPHIFRAYDIRGKAYDQISPEACRLIGQAFGSELRDVYTIESPRICVGHDARVSGPELEDALIEGLVASGCHVLRIGMTPSPVNYFTIVNSKLDGGVQVTASHNPAPDNGLKLSLAGAHAFAGKQLQRLRERIEREDFLTGEGSVEGFATAQEVYAKALIDRFTGIGDGKRIGIDAGNGAAGPMAMKVMEAIGADTLGLYTEPDGTFPNHQPDPSKIDTLRDLQEAVRTEDLDIGFAFDGDGDRVGLIDNTGAIRSSDDVLLLLAKEALRKDLGATVISTVSNSGVLGQEIERMGGKHVMCKVGHSHVEHAMLEHDAILGGEQSGHFFFAKDSHGYDDALVAALSLLEIVHTSDKSVSELCEGIPKTFQSPERRPFCPDDKKGAIIEKATEHFSSLYPVVTLDGARIDFGGADWAGIRQSNTSPCISICIEATTAERLSAIEDEVLTYLQQFPEIRWDG